MLDWSLVAGFDWDAGNARKSADKHGASQAEAEEVFFNQPLLVLKDDRHSLVEARFHALGKTNESRRMQITFTLRANGARIRVISARDMSARERAIYGEKR